MLPAHRLNAGEADYLYKYYRGQQPVLLRTKEVRPEINNKVVENRANEIVAFKTGYCFGEPIQYVAAGGLDNKIQDALQLLNRYMEAAGKTPVDKEMADWMHIQGNAYRFVSPAAYNDMSLPPFRIRSLDPRMTFVVYGNGIDEDCVLGVTYVCHDDQTTTYYCYTRDMYYEVKGSTLTAEWVETVKPHALGAVPIIEYPLNSARLGAFEIVLPLLDALNEVASDRLDGVDQFIEALLLFHNVDIDAEMFEQLRALGALAYADVSPDKKGEVKYISQQLDQNAVQSFVNYAYDAVLTICGMPNRNGGYSTSDTGTAVIMRDGWYAAESRAKDTEIMFKASERNFLATALNICRSFNRFTLLPWDIDVKFTRRNYDNIQAKAQVLVTLLEKIPPRQAYIYCNMFTDPEAAYQEYEDWQKAQSERIQEASISGTIEEKEEEISTESDDDRAD